MSQNLSIVVLFLTCLSITGIRAQDCIFYTSENHAGPAYDMSIGTSLNVNISNGLSWELNNNAAIRIEDPSPPSGYPWRYVYANEDADYINGSDNWDDIGILTVTCEDGCNSVDCMPQPSAWIPIDYTDFNGNLTGGINNSEVGDRVLVLRKAFLHENSEDVGGWHGPYGNISIHCRPSNFFTDYNNSVSAIEADYDEDGTWITQYGPKIADVKLAGPVYYATSFFGPNPESEWIDGPWGVCYSRVVIHNWDDGSNYNSISVFIREGDPTATDDFMGGQVVNKNTTGPILVYAWMYGWFVVENIVLTQEDMSENISDSDYYWNQSWNGSHPESIQGMSSYDQYNPLPNTTIDDMQNSFDAGSKVGLLGGSFDVTGILDKPMIYTAPCESAIFND